MVIHKLIHSIWSKEELLQQFIELVYEKRQYRLTLRRDMMQERSMVQHSH